MDSIRIGAYQNTDYVFFPSTRKVTAHSVNFQFDYNTLLKFALDRPNSDKVNETALSVFSKNAGIVIAPATNEQTALTAVVSAGGSMTIGVHEYYVAFGYGSSETLVGSISSQYTTTSGQQTITLDLTNNLGATGCTYRKVYKRTNSGAWYLRGTLADNTTTTYSDTVVDNTTTAAPTTTTAYDIKWGATYNTVATPTTATGDKFWIEITQEDTINNWETGVTSVQTTNSLVREYDSTIPVATAQAITNAWVVLGSSFSTEARNVHRCSIAYTQGTSITDIYLKIVGFVEAGDTDVFPIGNLKFDKNVRFIEEDDLPSGTGNDPLIKVYRLSTLMNGDPYVLTQKFAFTIFTDNTTPEIALYVKGVGASFTGGAITLEVNSAYSDASPKCNEPKIFKQYLLATVTNQAAATYYYPSANGIYIETADTISISSTTSGGVTTTFEVNDDVTWIDCTRMAVVVADNAVANQTGQTGLASFVNTAAIKVDFNNLVGKVIRIKDELSTATNTVKHTINRRAL